MKDLPNAKVYYHESAPNRPITASTNSKAIPTYSRVDDDKARLEASVAKRPNKHKMPPGQAAALCLILTEEKHSVKNLLNTLVGDIDFMGNLSVTMQLLDCTSPKTICDDMFGGLSLNTQGQFFFCSLINSGLQETLTKRAFDALKISGATECENVIAASVRMPGLVRDYMAKGNGEPATLGNNVSGAFTEKWERGRCHWVFKLGNVMRNPDAWKMKYKDELIVDSPEQAVQYIQYYIEAYGKGAVEKHNVVHRFKNGNVLCCDEGVYSVHAVCFDEFCKQNCAFFVDRRRLTFKEWFDDKKNGEEVKSLREKWIRAGRPMQDAADNFLNDVFRRSEMDTDIQSGAVEGEEAEHEDPGLDEAAYTSYIWWTPLSQSML